MQHPYTGIMLSAAAGSATVIGAVLCVFLPVTARSLAICLGFSAGIMITVSLADLIPGAVVSSLTLFGQPTAAAVVFTAILFGMVAALILTRFFPCRDRENLVRLGLLSSAALILHNLPEGAAVFAGAGTDMSLGISLAAAIALHNIPEGISVAMPIYTATKSRIKAVLPAAVSGIAEPFGAALTYLITGGKVSEKALCVIFSSVAGIMVCLSFSELLPEGMRKSFGGALFGALSGVAVMVLSVSVF